MQNAEAIARWENDGGALERMKPLLVGTENQIAWAEQIRAKVDAEFDRVAAALQSVAARPAQRDRSRTQTAIAVLEEKREGVMSRSNAGYFIKEWQEMRDQVRLLVTNDIRYKSAQRDKVTATESKDH